MEMGQRGKEREQRGLGKEKVRGMSPRELRLSWEKRQSQEGWTRGKTQREEQRWLWAGWEMQLEGDRPSDSRS